MDPFHVTCETCRARLKIRSASVIGQIHACPKCESMVHIVPPPGWVPSTAMVAESAISSPVEVTMAGLPAAAAGPSLLVWAMGGVAVLLVAGLGVMMWPRGEQPENTPPQVAAVEPVILERPVENPVLEIPVEEPKGELVAALPPSDPPEVIQDEAAEPAAVETPAEQVAVAAPETSDSSAPPLVAPPAKDVSEKKPVLKFDPLDFDPAQLSLGGAAVPPATEASSSVADANAEPTVVEVKDDVPAGQEPALPAIGDPSVTVRLGPETTDALRPRNVAQQLGLKIEALDLTPLPLARFVEVVSEMGNVAVTVDPSALAMAGVSPQATVEVNGRNTTLDKLFRDGLAKVRLDFVERNGQLVVVHPNRDARRGVDYDVADLLAPGAKDAGAISELVQRLVAPDAWQAGTASGSMRVDGKKLHVEHANHVQIQVLMFCERLRLARGLVPRSRYPVEQLSIDSPYTALSATVEKKTTFTFLPWTRLEDVFENWQKTMGVTILLDWEALAREELAPATPISCSAINRTWGEALDAVLEPLGLAWWAIDGETIQITSQAALASIERIEFYTPPRGKAAVDQVANGAKHVERDAASGRWVVLGTPDVHRSISGEQVGLSRVPQQDEGSGIDVKAAPAEAR